MLMIIMHNNPEFLNSIRQLAQIEGIDNSRIIEKENLGIRLIGGNTEFIFSKGQLHGAYRRALAVTIEGEEKARRFLNTIESDVGLEIANLQNKGFICVLPLKDIKELGAA